MKKETLQRTYTTSVSLTKGQAALLNETYLAYNRGGDAFFDTFSNFCASVEPDAEPYIIKTKQENGDDLETVIPAPTQCFLGWFQPELGGPEHLVIQPDQIRATFKKYWKASGGGKFDDPVLELLLSSLDSISDDVQWIDRHRGLRELLNFTGLEKKDVATLCSIWGAPFVTGEAKIEPSKRVRGIISLLWGEDDQKSDWSAAGDMYRKLYQSFEHSLNNGCKTTRDVSHECLKSLGIDTARKFSAEEITSLLRPKGKNGRNDGYISAIVSLYQDNRPLTKDRLTRIKQVQRALKEKITDAEQLHELEIPPKARQKLLKVIEDRSAVSYVNAGKRLFAEYCLMARLALSRLSSSRSNNINQVHLRIALNERLLAAKAKAASHPSYARVNSLVQGFKTAHPHETQEFLHLRQIRCAENVLKAVKKMAPLDAIALVREQNKQLFGDGNLLQTVAEIEVEKDDFIDAMNCLLDISTVENLEERVTSLKHWPSTHLVDDRLDHPRFGGSNEPRGEVRLEGDKFVFAFDALVDGKPAPIEVAAFGKRLRNEIYARSPNAVEGIRNHHLARIQADEEIACNADLDNLSFQLHRKEGFYSLNVAIPLKITPTPSLKEIKAHGWTRFLAIDIGQREAISYAVLDVGSDADPFAILRPLRGSKKPVPLVLVETGKIRDAQDLKPGQRTITVCRLSTCSRPSTDDEVAFFDSLGIKTQAGEAVKAPRDVCKLNLEIAWHIHRQVRKRGIKAQPMLGKVHRYFFQNTAWLPGDINRRRGGLSWNRIETFNVLRRAYSSMISTLEVNECKVPQWLTDARDRLQERNRARKRERAKVAVSRVLRFALQAGVDVIAVEGSTVKTSQLQSRWLNRRTSDWLPSFTLQEIEKQAELYGIFIKRVRPRDTSKRDAGLASNPKAYEDRKQYGTRLSKRGRFASQKEIERLVGRCFNSNRWGHELATRWYEAKAKEWGIPCEPVDIASFICHNLKLSDYIADPYGQFFNSVRGEVDADDNAAINIGIGAIRSIYDLLKGRERRGKPKKAVAARKA